MADIFNKNIQTPEKIDFKSISKLTYNRNVVLFQLSYLIQSESGTRTHAKNYCSNLPELYSQRIEGFEPSTHSVGRIFWKTLKTFSQAEQNHIMFLNKIFCNGAIQKHSTWLA